ncbi:MAG: hypothetical protein ACLPND_23300 [Candidatus Korobacteraceae bacterium]|jgi:hypothetical protein
MKPVSVVVFVLLLATTVFAGSPPVMTPSQQMQALQLRLAQFEGRYDTFDAALQACGGTPEVTAAWKTADSNFNSFVDPLCGGDSTQFYDTSANNCVNAPYLTFAQQYQAMELRIAQYTARYAALDLQSYQACGTQATPNSEWTQADTAMNAFLLATCGGYQHYSTSMNQCQ